MPVVPLRERVVEIEAALGAGLGVYCVSCGDDRAR